MNLYSETRDATLEEVSIMRRGLRRRMNNLAITDDVADDLQLVLAEWGANLVSHAGTRPTSIDLSLDMTGALLTMTIADNGSPYAEITNVSPEAAIHEDPFCEESGRGLGLIVGMVDGLAYHSGCADLGQKNRLVLQRQLLDRRPTVLVVDDDTALANTYAAFLGKDYKTIVATKLQTALKHAKSSPVDLILTDYHLDEGTGEGIIKIIEEDAGKIPAPVIMITGDTDPALKIRLEDLGIESVLNKPVAPVDLKRAVRHSLRRSMRARTGLLRHFEAVSHELGSSKGNEVHIPGFLLDRKGGSADVGTGDALVVCAGDGFERVVLVDMVGHGIVAQACGVAFLAMLRTVHTLNRNLDAGTYLEKVNEVLLGDINFSGLLCTLIVLDCFENGEMRIASAGHVEPALIKNGKLEQLPVSGGLIALMPNQEFETTTIKLGLEDHLILMTDGLDPAGLAHGASVPAWLEKALLKRHQKDGTIATEHLQEDIIAELGPEPEDDWTLICVRRQPESEPESEEGA
ncbi:response regulator [Rhodobacteraceae bacterium RKSG542]|uniref:SpoIIE family protein phosphatase n=1 Tax=Pseudovibrio flavus TaxID=2529854 RepID=UPI0012BC124C|nr:SpoIIE family protein phosphatase [Pseudovibrio flavus]MTI18904.1 response regulator [Pseudovibrio flavus]